MNIESLQRKMSRQVRRAGLLLFLGMIFSSCAQQDGSRLELSGAQLLEKLDAGWDPVVLDVRSSMEYASGHVPGAVHLSFWTPLVDQESVQADSERPVVIYCEHGPRAYIAAYGLRKAGFTDVHYLDGHMSKWRKEELPMEKPGGD